MAASRLERILGLLRARGGRVTTSRRAIVGALLDATDHVTAEELAATVRAHHPDIHTSTVYRCLDTLADLEVVTHVHLGHGPAVYHLADEVHHHLVCDSCGDVVVVPPPMLGSFQRQIQQTYGFRLDATHFALAGRCAACLASADATPGTPDP
jgi:Fe2+ or Zn2+ uptake regulation protein